jgi:O-antigen ligase
MIPKDRWGWRALLILVPLFYNPLSLWQYEPDKVALTIMLTAILLGNAIRRGNLPRLVRSRVTWAILGYVLVRWLTMTRSIAPELSVWGDPGWRSGLWITLAGVILFVLARQYCSVPHRREEAITAILIGSALVSAYGVWQYFNPFKNQDVVRTASTMAHPNLLAAYLAMVMPLTAARLLRGHRRQWWGGLFALQGVCLVLTYSRAGWLGAMSGLAVWGIAQFWIAGWHRTVKIFTALLATGLVALLILSLLPPLPGDAPYTLQTLTSLFRWKGATAQIRLLGWEASLDAIRARPWLGYGPATFSLVLDWYLPPGLAPYGGASALGRRTHNVYLETTVESGLIGLAAYLMMLGAILIPIVRSLRRFEAPPDIRSNRTRLAVQAGILAALVADLINNFFSFDSAVTAILFWTLAGMAHAAPDAEEIKREPAAHPARWGWLVSLTGVTLAVWMIAPDMLAYRGDQLAQESRWKEAAWWFDQASHIAPIQDTFLEAMGTVYADWATETDDAAIWARGVPLYTKLVSRRPDVVEYQRRRGLYFHRWHTRQSSEGIAQQAIDSYTTALRLSPTNPDLWLDRGLIRLQADDPAGALADFEQANRLLDGYTRYYGAMSIYALATGDREAAAAWNAQALAAQQKWDDWVWRR